jgi:predicted enzyme related to lactoylglutathione lyase
VLSRDRPEQVVGLGGSVVRQPEDTPYGRLAEAADTNGARFELVQG